MNTNIIHNDDICNYFLKNQQFIFNSLGNCRECRKHIAKHKKDVFRLAAMLAPADRFTVPESLLNDIRNFCEKAVEDLPNADFFKSAGLKGVTAERLLESLNNSFN